MAPETILAAVRGAFIVAALRCREEVPGAHVALWARRSRWIRNERGVDRIWRRAAQRYRLVGCAALRGVTWGGGGVHGRMLIWQGALARECEGECLWRAFMQQARQQAQLRLSRLAYESGLLRG